MRGDSQDGISQRDFNRPTGGLARGAAVERGSARRLDGARLLEPTADSDEQSRAEARGREHQSAADRSSGGRIQTRLEVKEWTDYWRAAARRPRRRSAEQSGIFPSLAV